MNVPVSILIPVKNEAGNLPRCLDAVAWADKVLVVDSRSTDATCEIAAARGAKVVQFEFGGTWPKKKNFAGYHFARLHGFYEYLCVVKTAELKRLREEALREAGAGSPNDRIPRS